MAYPYRSSSSPSDEESDDLSSEKSFDWAEYLMHNSVECVPVDSFSTAPLSREWKLIALSGLMVEVEVSNSKGNSESGSYWVGETGEYHGYMTQIRYLGAPIDDETPSLIPYVWKNFASEVFRIGHSSKNKHNLIPPFDTKLYYPLGDFRDYVINAITGQYTLHPTMSCMIDSDNVNRFSVGSAVEVLDKSNVSQMKLGTVDKIVGHRLLVQYWDCKDDEGIWCNDMSQSVHKCGWSKTVGHAISAPVDYNPPELTESEVNNGVRIPDIKIQEGMKLEAVDPCNLLDICAATISKVLHYGYFLVSFDNVEIQENHSNRVFCYHILSNMIFPCGFCKQNNIPFTGPAGWQNAYFDWKEYFIVTGSIPLNLKGIRQENIEHKFKVGYKLEAVDTVNSNLICVATVSKVVGRLLRINFDGWEDTYDQWTDVASPDLFPAGWCQFNGYRLESPKKNLDHTIRSSTKKTNTNADRVEIGSRETINVYSLYDDDSSSLDEDEEDVSMSPSPPTSPHETVSKSYPETLIASKEIRQPEQNIVGKVYALGRKNVEKPKLSQEAIRQLITQKSKDSINSKSSRGKTKVSKE